MNRLPTRLLCLLMVSLLATSAFAAEVVLDLSTMPGTDCGVGWIEGPCVLWFEAVTAEDYQPVQPAQLVCFPFMNGTTLILFPARLCVDLQGVEGIESIEVDIHEGAALHATRVMAYLGDTYVKEVNSATTNPETVVLPVSTETFDTLVVSGWETAVTEIRLVGTTLVGDGDLSLGTVKALYR